MPVGRADCPRFKLRIELAMPEATFLKYGERFLRTPTDYRLYESGAQAGGKSVYYLIAGLVKLEVPRGQRLPFPYYVHPGSVLGVPESLLDLARPTNAVVKERSLLYRWDLVGFFMAVDISLELAQREFLGMTQMLRVLNAEASDG